MAGKNLEENLKGSNVDETIGEHRIKEKTTFYEMANLLFSKIVYHPATMRAASIFGFY